VRQAANRLITVKVMAGTGYAISAKIGEKIVTERETILQNPIVVVAKTRGNKSKCDMYKMQNWPDDPKEHMSKLKGNMWFWYISVWLHCSKRGTEPISWMTKKKAKTHRSRIVL